MDKNISAEERLLKLIKDKKQGAPSNNNEELPSKNQENAFLPIFFNIKKLIKSKQSVDYLLASFCAATVAVLIFQLAARTHASKKETHFLKEKTNDEINASMAIKPYADFSNAVNTRQLFSASFIMQDEPNKIPAKEIKDAIKDISLVGIVVKQNKFIAVIEDKQANKTFFLNAGDNLGDLTIRHIEEGKVIFDYYGQEITLQL